jgi:hypothetical protein
MRPGGDRALTQALDLLRSLGAAGIAHPGGDLLAHLRRVHDIAVEWECSPRTQLAALCHAAYGTDGFPHALLPRTERSRLREVIGIDAESLVYVYGACDRGASYPHIAADGKPRVRDRFSGADAVLDGDDLPDFAALTIANELDVARFASLNGDMRSGIRSLVRKFAAYAPGAARRALEDPALR